MHLARGALSPLTVAVDTEQNIYWASNPRWFRDAERHTRVRFASVVMVREGTYVVPKVLDRGYLALGNQRFAFEQRER